MRIMCSCGRDMRPVRNGVLVVDRRDSREAFRLTLADEYGCDHCGQTVVAGFARGSTHQGDDAFEAMLRSHQESGLVREAVGA